MEQAMQTVQLKLKQASAVLGVAPKDLQNFVQFGVLRPRKRADVFWFDKNLLLQAKVAFYLKSSVSPTTEYLVQFMKTIARVDLAKVGWDSLLLSSAPEKGKSPVEIRIPVRELKEELQERLPLAETAKDLPRGRKRQGWKQEFIATLQQAGQDIGKVSDEDVRKAVRSYRTERRKRPEITIVAKARKSA